MKVIKVKNYEEMSDVAANLVIEAIQANPKLNLGLASGATPTMTYHNLAKANEEGKISFKDVKVFALDEYWGLPKEDPGSFYYYYNENFFTKIDIKKENIFAPDAIGEPTQQIPMYQAILDANDIDLQLLGLGNNGHIAFNEPGTPFDARVHLVDLSDTTMKQNEVYFDEENKMPPQGFTMGIADIMEGKKLVVMASGKVKAPVVKELLEGEKSLNFPASVLFDHEDVTLIFDEEAGSLLED